MNTGWTARLRGEFDSARAEPGEGGPLNTGRVIAARYPLPPELRGRLRQLAPDLIMAIAEAGALHG